MAQTRTAGQLQDEKYTLVTDSQEVREIAHYAGLSEKDADDITAAIVEVGDGEYNEIWLSESSAPWNLTAIYHEAAYWDTDDPTLYGFSALNSEGNWLNFNGYATEESAQRAQERLARNKGYTDFGPITSQRTDL